METCWKKITLLFPNILQIICILGFILFLYAEADTIPVLQASNETETETESVLEETVPSKTASSFHPPLAIGLLTALMQETAQTPLSLIPAEHDTLSADQEAPLIAPDSESYRILVRAYEINSAQANLREEMSSLFRLQPAYLPDITEFSLNREQLEMELSSRLESYSGDWSIYVKDLSNDDVINLNEHPMESASLIKLFIMGAVMEQISYGNIEESDSIDHLLEEMITVSDNSAANELVRCLSADHDHQAGLEKVNDFAKRHGYLDTNHVNGLSDSSLWYDTSLNNETSARDCGELLAAIYDGTLVSHLASRQMEDLLLAQEVTYKIPYALPSEAVSASKTGEIDYVENDSAIVYSPGGDFILCILSNDVSSESTAIRQIRDLTSLVYRYFNPPEDKVEIAEAEKE